MTDRAKLVFVASAIASAMSGCSPSTAASGDAHAAVPVIVARAATTSRPNRLEALGTIEPSDTVAVKSRVDGQVKSVQFHEGDHVTLGQLLYQLDDGMVRAQIAAAEALYERDAAQARQAEAEFERDRTLAAKGFESQSALDIARAAAESAVAAAKSDTAQVDVLKQQLQYYTIKAPVAGRTGESAVKPGADIKAIDTTTLVTINQLSPVRARFSIPPSMVAEAHEHSAANDAVVLARIHGQNGPMVTGRLAFMDNAVDAGNGELLAKGEFANVDERLWPGTLVDIELRLGSVANLVALPESAVQLGEAGSFVFVANHNDIAERRSVQVFERDHGNVFVSKGLSAGDRVVVEGAANLAPGTKLSVGSRAAALAAPGPTP